MADEGIVVRLVTRLGGVEGGARGDVFGWSGDFDQVGDPGAHHPHDFVGPDALREHHDRTGAQGLTHRSDPVRTTLAGLVDPNDAENATGRTGDVEHIAFHRKTLERATQRPLFEGPSIRLLEVNEDDAARSAHRLPRACVAEASQLVKGFGARFEARKFLSKPEIARIEANSKVTAEAPVAPPTSHPITGTGARILRVTAAPVPETGLPFGIAISVPLQN